MPKLKDSTAWGCRWFDVLQHASVGEERPTLAELGELEVLADFSEDDYQGDVRVAFIDVDETCYYIEYSYGSCSGCDQWEDQGDDVARQEILKGMVALSKEEFIKFAAPHAVLKQVVEELVSKFFN